MCVTGPVLVFNMCNKSGIGVQWMQQVQYWSSMYMASLVTCLVSNDCDLPSIGAQCLWLDIYWSLISQFITVTSPNVQCLWHFYYWCLMSVISQIPEFKALKCNVSDQPVLEFNKDQCWMFNVTDQPSYDVQCLLSLLL